jgi:hypothetical protein
MPVDGGGDDSVVLSGAIDATTLWVRTRLSIYGTPRSGPPLWTRLTSTPYEFFFGGIAADQDHVFVAARLESKIYEVNKSDGGRREIASADYPRFITTASGRVVWLDQPWSAVSDGRPSGVRAYVNGATTALYDQGGDLAGFAENGGDVFVLRVAGDAGSLLRVGMDAAVEVLANEPSSNRPNYMDVAADAMHVYWLRQSTTEPDFYDVVKRARCGGATVTLMKGLYRPVQVAVMGDRVFANAQLVLTSVAK